jgi:hypothetical protein
MCEDAWYVHIWMNVECPFLCCVTCAEDLRTQFQDAEKSAARLTSGTDAVRAIVVDTQLVFFEFPC